MKRFYKLLMIALAGAVALGAYSCDNVDMYDMMVTPSTVDVEASHEAPTPVRIAVTAGHDWFVQSTADWITVSNITSTGFTINFDSFAGYVPDNRSGVVLVSSQIGQWPVVVNQERVPFSTYEEYMASTYTLTGKANSLYGTNPSYKEEQDAPLSYNFTMSWDSAGGADFEWLYMGPVLPKDFGGYDVDFAFYSDTFGLTPILSSYGFFLQAWAYYVPSENAYYYYEMPTCYPDLITGKFNLPKTATVNGNEYALHLLYVMANPPGPWSSTNMYSYDSIYDVELVMDNPVSGWIQAPAFAPETQSSVKVKYDENSPISNLGTVKKK